MKKSTFMFAILIAFCTTLSAQDKMKAEKTVRDLFVVMDAGQTDKFKDYVSPDFKIMNPFLPSPMPLQAFQGIIQGQKTAFPNMQHEIVSIISDGKNVITKGVFRGTNTGSFMEMAPTNNKVNATFLAWDEMDNNNKVKMRKVEFDVKGFEAQLMAGKVSTELIKKNTMTAYESLSKRDFATFKSVCTSDFTELTAGPMPIKGVDASIEAYKMFFALSPDIKFTVKSIAVDGNRAFVENTITGTNTGMVMGMLPPTGKKFMYTDIDIVTVDASGKAISHSSANPNEIFHQIGYGSLVNPNTGVVMNIYENFGKRNIEGIISNFAEKGIFDMTENPFITISEVYKSNKEIPQFFSKLMAEGETTKFEPNRILADGDDVTAYINVDFKPKAAGKTWSTIYVHQFKIINGKVVNFKQINTKPRQINELSSMK